MRIVLVGAGKLATNVGVALQQAGHEIVQVYSRTQASADALAQRLNCKSTTHIDEIVTDAALYLLALTDSALSSVLPSLCRERPQAVFAHTAGSVPISVFEGFAKHFGVLYPMQTFDKNILLDFKKIPVFIEANDEKTEMLLQTLAGELSTKVYHLASEERKHLHLAAVFACNFVNHCYAASAHLLEKHHLPFDVLLPLIDETARKVHRLKPLQAQTGPAVRFDANVMAAQKALLADEPQLSELYEKLSQSIHQYATNPPQHDKL